MSSNTLALADQGCCGCCICVHTSHTGLIEKLGKFNRVADPGCHCLNPCTERVSGVISLRVMPIPLRVESKTKDNVLLTVAVAVHYQVIEAKVVDAFYKFSNPYQQISDYASNVIRGQVPRYTVDEIFVVRDEIEKSLKAELDKNMERFGFNIVAALITDIDPNDSIKQAMSQINTNARLRVAMGFKADADKIAIIKAAEADAESKRLSGVGLAEMRKAAILGLQSSVENFTGHVRGVGSKEVMSLLLMNQYFDALKDIAHVSKGNVIFVQGSKAGAQDVAEGCISASQAQNKSARARA